MPEKHPITEEDAKIGVGPYGESKVMAEQLVQDFRKEGSVISSIRPKTFIGTGRLGVFQILFDWIQKGARIPIIGNGDATTPERIRDMFAETGVDAVPGRTSQRSA